MINNWIRRSKVAELSYSTMIIIILLSLFSTISEIFGISIFLPIFQYISTDGDISTLINDSKIWKYLIRIFDYFSISVELYVLLVLSFSFFLFRQLFLYIRMVYRATVLRTLERILRIKIFNHYLSADASFHDKMPAGNLVNVITTEVSTSINGIVAPLDLVVQVIMVFGYLIIMALLSWEMTVSVVIILLLATRIPKIWFNQSAQIGRKLTSANIKISEFLVERLRSPRLVRLSGTQNAENDMFEELTDAQRKQSIRSAILLARTDVIVEPVVIGMSLVFIYFAYSILNMQIEVIGLYLVIILRLMPATKGIISQWQTILNYLGPMEIIDERLDSMRLAKEQDGGVINYEDVKEGLEFRKVYYKYPSSNTDSLINVSFKILSGSIVALVGPSGSGKSTLIDLIPSLRSPYSGSIVLDDINICDIRLESLRSKISYLPQSPQIFNGTIEDHIKYGNPNANDDDIINALKISGAYEFVKELPLKHKTNLGNEAVSLSGGQRQRIDLARVIVKKSKIMIFDEPTSNLDIESENIFFESMYRIQKELNSTIIIVSHDLSAVQGADKIIVLKNGEVKEIGTHQDLVINNGWYAKTWKIQSNLLSLNHAR